MSRRPSRGRASARPRLESLEARRLLSLSTLADTDGLAVSRSVVVETDGAPDGFDWRISFPGGRLVKTSGDFALVELPSDPAFRRAVSQPLSRLHVRSVEPVRTLSVNATPNDPFFSNLWGLNNTGQTGGTADADIDAPEAWDLTTGSTRVVVGVIDTGVDYTHPDLYKNIWINQDEIPASIRPNLTDTDGDQLITFWDLNEAVNQGAGKARDLDGNGRVDGKDLLAPLASGGWQDGVDADANGYTDDLIGWDFITSSTRPKGDNDPMDDHSHGTHVAGTIGAMGNNGVGVAGISWRTLIMPLRFMDATGNGSDFDGAAAIRYATAKGVRVTNNSWGGSDDTTVLHDAITAAGASGSLFVAAAGNSGANLDTGTFYPAGYADANIVSVAASTSTDARASWSNYGAVGVDLAAPGSSIVSTTLNGAYGSKSGTSMAAPHVTGTVSLMLAANGNLTAPDIKRALIQTVDRVAAFSANTVSGGRLNARAAVAAVMPTATAADLGLTSVTADADRLVVRYQLSAAATAPVTLQLYRSDDASAASASRVLVGTVSLSAAADLTSGAHEVNVAIGTAAGAAALPGAGAAEVDADYYLVAVGSLAGDPVATNNLAPLTGVYRGTDGTAFVHGGDSADSVVAAPVDSATFSLSVGTRSYPLPLAAVPSIRVRTHGGTDSVTARGVSRPLWAWGGDDDDSLEGGTAADRLLGGSGADLYRTVGTDAADVINVTVVDASWLQIARAGVLDRVANDQADRLEILGGLGDDQIILNAAVMLPATLDGGSGRDILNGGGGNDTLRGGDDGDFLNGGPGDDLVDGGLGTDEYNYDGTSDADNLTLVAQASPARLLVRRLGATGAQLGLDQALAVERVQIKGQGGDDRLDASALTVADRTALGIQLVGLGGNGGNDTLIGSQGADTLSGGAGNDRLDGRGGADVVQLQGDGTAEDFSIVVVAPGALRGQRRNRLSPFQIYEADDYTIDASDYLEIWAFAGDDTITVAPDVPIAGTIYGGQGIDTATAPASWRKLEVEA